MEPDGQPAVGLLLDELVRAVIPDLDRAGAVVALRDLALERRVLERMVLDVHGEMLLAGLERHALRHGPRGEHAVALEAEVVVEAPRVVPLHDEDRELRRGACAPNGSGVFLGSRFRSYSESLSLTSRIPIVHTTHT